MYGRKKNEIAQTRIFADFLIWMTVNKCKRHELTFYWQVISNSSKFFYTAKIDKFFDDPV